MCSNCFTSSSNIFVYYSYCYFFRSPLKFLHKNMTVSTIIKHKTKIIVRRIFFCYMSKYLMYPLSIHYFIIYDVHCFDYLYQRKYVWIYWNSTAKIISTLIPVIINSKKITNSVRNFLCNFSYKLGFFFSNYGSVSYITLC